MKRHTTNYFNTLICPAEDCKVVAKVPDKPGAIATLQYELLIGQPYRHTSDDVLSGVAAKRKDIAPKDLEHFRADFFSKGQPCFRASPLTKTHGWAIHANEDGYVALIAPDDPLVAKLIKDPRTKTLYAMRNKRK